MPEGRGRRRREHGGGQTVQPLHEREQQGHERGETPVKESARQSDMIGDMKDSAPMKKTITIELG